LKLAAKSEPPNSFAERGGILDLNQLLSAATRDVTRGVMPKKPTPDAFAELEKTQQKLRENIEESKQLVEKAQELIQKAKGEPEGS